MANPYRLVVLTAGMVLISSAVHAQQNICEANIGQVLAEYGVKLGDVADPAWQTLRWAHRGDANGPVIGYQFTGRPPSCTAGGLYVTVTTGCEISDMHTAGGCMIRGIPNHWW